MGGKSVYQWLQCGKVAGLGRGVQNRVGKVVRETTLGNPAVACQVSESLAGVFLVSGPSSLSKESLADGATQWRELRWEASVGWRRSGRVPAPQPPFRAMIPVPLP